MAKEIPDFGAPDDTRMAVVIGALPATRDGFLAALVELAPAGREAVRCQSLSAS